MQVATVWLRFVNVLYTNVWIWMDGIRLLTEWNAGLPVRRTWPDDVIVYGSYLDWRCVCDRDIVRIAVTVLWICKYVHIFRMLCETEFCLYDTQMRLLWQRTERVGWKCGAGVWLNTLPAVIIDGDDLDHTDCPQRLVTVNTHHPIIGHAIPCPQYKQCVRVVMTN